MPSSHFRSLEDLHQEMAACRQCLRAGFEIYPRAIYSGAADAKVMIIGQAPGITETEAGRPFNAGSGTRLFKWLTACGFEETAFRAQEYMTSVTKCYPGKSLNGRGDRVPTRAEQHLCESFLEAEIAFVQPDILLPVGRLAINRYWSANKPLRDIIGTEKQTQERWIIPLPHPSGASPWHQNRENRLLIEKALTLIRSHKSRLGI